MTSSTVTEAEEVVSALRRFISRGEYGLKEVPQLIKEVLQHGYWREGGRRFARFAAFVEAEPPPGLGASVELVRHLIAEDTEALDLFDKELAHPSGRPPKTGAISTHSARRGRGHGTDRVTALRRLRKDRPDLHALVLAGGLTPHGAMVEAGFRRRAYRLPLTVAGVVAAIRRHFSAEQIADIRDALGSPPKC